MATKAEQPVAKWKHFVAGATGGACEILVTMPLDVIKTTMQLGKGGGSASPLSVGAEIVRAGGPRALYYGMPAFLTQTSGKASIRFLAFAQAKETLTAILGAEAVEANPTAVALGCGLLAGTAEAMVWTTPTERLKVLRQSEVGAAKPRFSSLAGSVRVIIGDVGLTGLWVGALPTAARQASSVGVRFMLYNPVKTQLKNAGLENPFALSLLAGGSVGGLSVIINNPLDVIKSRVQSSTTRLGAMAAARAIVAKKGLAGFGAGLSARVPRVFCGQAITFAVYEKMSAFLAPL